MMLKVAGAFIDREVFNLWAFGFLVIRGIASRGVHIAPKSRTVVS